MHDEATRPFSPSRGTWVRIDGLVSAPQWNGRSARVIGEQIGERYPVQVLDLQSREKKEMKVKAANLREGCAVSLLLKNILGMNIEAVRSLLDRGLVSADEPDPADPDGFLCAVELATTGMTIHGENFFSMFELVVKSTTNVDVRSGDGATSLMRAASAPSPKAVRLLLDLGADVNATDPTGFTALLVTCTAAKQQAREVIEMLLHKGASVAHRTKDGRSALVLCAINNNVECMEALLRHDNSLRLDLAADLDAVAYALNLDHQQILKLLQNAVSGSPSQLQLFEQAQRAQHLHIFTNSLVPVNNSFTGKGFKGRKEQMKGLAAAILKASGHKGEITESVGNPLLTVHSFLSSMIPDVLNKSWESLSDISPSELVILSILAGGEGLVDPERHHPAVHFVSMGKCVSAYYGRFLDSIKEPMHNCFACAIPNEEALTVITRHSPIVEVGAGSGYWAALLRARGATVVALDKEPPSEAKLNNSYFHHTFTEVEKGGPEDVSKYPDHTMLLVWPHDPAESAQKPFDVECVRAFKGTTVIHVGEWRGKTCSVTDASGETTSADFQAVMTEAFEVVPSTANL